jgi:hypothetical protein
MRISAIETYYAGCRFRSRLESRWAVFFDALDLEWQYEPQGFRTGGRAYLPDFHLPYFGTWVEVKGAESELDHDLMLAAAKVLPHSGGGPGLLILGPIPEPPAGGDWAWLGLTAADMGHGETEVFDGWWGFGYLGILRASSETSSAPPVSAGDDNWLVPQLDLIRKVDPQVIRAYRDARSARFEHGQSGTS